MQNSPQSPIIEASKLTKQFGTFTAVDAISFEVERGEIFGFLGANGAGKTTAMRMLTGLSRPTSGQARVAGIDVAAHPEKVKQRIGYMSQKFSLYEDLTVMENIRFYGGIYGLPRKQARQAGSQLIEQLGMEAFARKQVSGIPLGWRQKLSFSIALLHQPDVVFLDEPTGGVDPVTRRQFWEMIYQAAETGTTVFVTTHYMDEAEYCGRVSIMVDGQIAALDTPDRLKSEFQAANMHEVFLQLTRPKP